MKTVAHIVHGDSWMILDGNHYDSWREIQNAYPDYKASFGPCSEAEIVEFFNADFGKDDSHWPFTRSAIAEFFSSTVQLLEKKDVG